MNDRLTLAAILLGIAIFFVGVLVLFEAGCASAKPIVRGALDARQIACVLASSLDVAEARAACEISDILDPYVRELVSARRQMVAVGALRAPR